MEKRYGEQEEGKSGSQKSADPSKPWKKYSPKEVEELVIKLKKEGKSPSQIGNLLKNQYGIPKVELITDKSITEILEEHDLSPKIPEDLYNLMERALNVRKHIKENKGDLKAKRNLRKIESKIKRLVKYYRREGRLPKDFKYSHKKLKKLVSG